MTGRVSLAYSLGIAALVAAILVAVVVVHLWFAWPAEKRRVEARFGITVVLEDVDFPRSMRAARTRYRLTLPFERLGILRRLTGDLSRYRESFLGEHLDSVVILRSLEIAGLAYGGTYDRAARRVYLDSAWVGDDGGDEAMGFHHEFSSLLMHRYPGVFQPDRWTRLNPDGYAYPHAVSGPANLVTGATDLVGDPETWSKGFLCTYGSLTLEDDINTFAEYLVAGKQRWPGLASRYPRLEAKMALLASWYCEIGALADRTRCG